MLAIKCDKKNAENPMKYGIYRIIDALKIY